jgi:hypothetical protein
LDLFFKKNKKINFTDEDFLKEKLQLILLPFHKKELPKTEGQLDYQHYWNS